MNNLENILTMYGTIALIIFIMYFLLPFIIILAYSIISSKLKNIENTMKQQTEILKMIDIRLEDIRIKQNNK